MASKSGNHPSSLILATTSSLAFFITKFRSKKSPLIWYAGLGLNNPVTPKPPSPSMYTSKQSVIGDINFFSIQPIFWAPKPPRYISYDGVAASITRSNTKTSSLLEEVCSVILSFPGKCIMAPRMLQKSLLSLTSLTSKSSPVKDIKRSATANVRVPSESETEDENGFSYGKELCGTNELNAPPDTILLKSSNMFIFKLVDDARFCCNPRRPLLCFVNDDDAVKAFT
mmetsp:Transcript_22039/g.24404  ORF Transcript_22039/g.24404 Transcript_22039/m.24404 type:complete len:227 (+) Transcript_22039:178-858(+)